MTARFHFSLVVLILAILSGCASLPPGSDFPKTTSSALAHPEQTLFGRRFADAAREHGGNSGFRMLAVGVDGYLSRMQMINSAERTIDLQYFIFRADETGQLLTDAVNASMTGNRMVMNGSMCLTGFQVRRPSIRAVSSPCLRAA